MAQAAGRATCFKRQRVRELSLDLPGVIGWGKSSEYTINGLRGIGKRS